MSVDPTKNPKDPAYRPPLDAGMPWPPDGQVSHPNLKEHLYANLGEEDLVLDIGCGSGPFEYHRFRPRFIAFDAFEPECADGLVAGRDRICVGRLERFPMPDSSCNAVVLGFILEHVPEPGLFLREADRVLKPGGWCYVSIPNHRSVEDRLFRLATACAGSTRGPHIQRFTFENFSALARSETSLAIAAWHLLPASFLWMQHPRLRMLRRPLVATLVALRRLGVDLLAEGNYQFLLRKPAGR